MQYVFIPLLARGEVMGKVVISKWESGEGNLVDATNREDVMDSYFH